MIDERLARLALSMLGEPGGPADGRAWSPSSGPSSSTPGCSTVATRTGCGPTWPAGSRTSSPSATSSGPPRRGIRWIVPGEPEWPAALDDLDAVEPLQELGGAPLGLWVRGPLRLDAPAGAGGRRRRPVRDDLRHRRRGRARAPGWPAPARTVVSGAAFGIDQAAHRGALAGDGPTVAVLACGVDRAYPAAHQQLLDHLGRALRRSCPSWRRAARPCGSGSCPATASSPRCPAARSWSRRRSAAAPSTPRAGRRGSTGR